jgi:hypothetical protein
MRFATATALPDRSKATLLTTEVPTSTPISSGSVMAREFLTYSYKVKGGVAPRRGEMIST